MADVAHNASDPASSETGDIASQEASRSYSPDRGKLSVFISYSREDLHFAGQLKRVLDFSGFESFMDLDIPGGEVWKRHIGKQISRADTVVFVLSPKSAGSEFCNWEADRANRLKKRILPIICQPLEGVEAPDRLKNLQWIYFCNDETKEPGSGFGSGLVKLVTALKTDFEWLREHTRYLQLAMQWEEGGRPTNRLLSGNDIVQAKAWAARRPKTAPELTQQHRDFINASEEAEESRLNEQRKQRDAYAEVHGMRKQWRIALVVAILAVGALSTVGWFLYQEHAISAAKHSIEEHENAGRFPEALKEQHALAEKVRTADAFDKEVWYELLTRNFRQALTDATRAHNRFPNNLEIETDRAHALMFMDRGDDAKALYLAHKGENVTGSKLWERAIAQDFAELRAKGLTHPMMTDIEKELGVGD